MKDKNAVELGRKGGNTTKKKGKAYYSKIGKLGAKKRWEDNLCSCGAKPVLEENIVCEDCL